MLNNEVWKPIKGFENYYEVSNLGNVRNSRKKMMKTYKINSGYLCIKFTVHNVRSSHLIHRLVLDTFNPCTDSYRKEVNHIDENKENNHLDNLQWVTSKENKQHSINSGRYDRIFTQCNTLGKKHLPNTTSKYHNVTYDKTRDKWTGGIMYQGKHLERKRFDTEIEAAKHVDYLIDKYRLHDRPKNFV